jgi:hypothetical protein
LEYYGHRTLSLFAALDTQSGEVLAQTVQRHTSAAFVEFLGDIAASQPKGREIHVILDNLATHKTQAVRTFLIAHPNVRLHVTRPTRRGSTKSNSGLPRSNATCSRAAFSRRSPIWRARFVGTALQQSGNRSAGASEIRSIELVVLQAIQATRLSKP